MCHHYRPAPVIQANVAELEKRIDDLEDQVSLIRGHLVL